MKNRNLWETSEIKEWMALVLFIHCQRYVCVRAEHCSQDIHILHNGLDGEVYTISVAFDMFERSYWSLTI